MASAKDPAVASDSADSLSERLQTLVAYASTVVQDPGSTVNPPREPSNDASRAALEAFEELGELLRTKAQHGLVTAHTLGEGGMGVVRLARQVALDRPVAVKTLKDAVRSRDMSLELLREAWITGSLEHPNVVPVYDLAMDPEGGPAIVLKRIEGVVWRDLLQDPEAVRQRFGAGDLLDWNLRTLISVCNAVAFAHERGIVHRDLKPENVMLGRFGEVYVLDWGIAVTTRADNPRLPHASAALAMASLHGPGNAGRSAASRGLALGHLLARGDPFRGAHGATSAPRVDAHRNDRLDHHVRVRTFRGYSWRNRRRVPTGHGA